MTLSLRLAFIILLFFCLKVRTQKTKCLRTEVKRTYSTVLDSFNRFYVKVKKMFTKPCLRLEKIRRRIKKAFYRFINESASSLHEPSLLRSKFTEHMDNLVPEMPIVKLIINQNFKLETHTVLTKDGYMVTVHRVLQTSSSSFKIAKKTIILYHGLWGSSIDWIILGPKKALPFLLLESGYDVWLANARGNKFSNSHVSKATDSSEYWNFSWHEIGLFDISSITDYVIETTQGKSEIIFIAYSMGATALLVLLSSSPQYNTVIKSVILIAPLVFMNHVRGPIRYLANVYEEDDLSFLRHNSRNELIPDGRFPNTVKKKFCRGNELLCSNILLLLGNGGKEISNFNVTASILHHVPAGGSKKTLLHYLQLIRSGKFQMFDYGYANTILYGNDTPPLYQLGNISTPVVVINSLNDWLSTVKDIAKLLPRIPVVNHTMILKNDFSHFDFLWADDAPRLVYFVILEYLNNSIHNITYQSITQNQANNKSTNSSY